MAEADVHGRVVVVTGAGSGMGAAMAAAFLEAGATVVGVDVNGQAVEAVRDRVRSAAGRLEVVEADLSDRGAAQAVIPQALDRAGGLDVLINNAGVGMAVIDPDYSVKPVKFWQADIARWERLMNINVRAPLILAQAATPILLERGWGRIVNVTTSLDTMILPSLSAYGQSKAALEAASASWARELQNTGVTVNVLVPGGPVDTAFLPSTTTLPRDRLIRPEVMGPPALWLASRAADGFTNRRIVARDWNPSLSSREEVEAASFPAAWAGYGPRAAVPNGG